MILRLPYPIAFCFVFCFVRPRGARKTTLGAGLARLLVFLYRQAQAPLLGKVIAARDVLDGGRLFQRSSRTWTDD